ncbi:pyridoxine 5'-phosphate synthase [Marinomonas agarivorans]|nr:pyridoxine 5'-phosphate synthase [Marinomonas agarivorans]
MTHLSVNLNKIGLLRNSRGRDFPNMVQIAKQTLEQGVFGITIHPRPDQRHATYQDVRDLKALLTQYPDRELNVEGFPSDEFLNIVLETQPHQCTLVPDDPNQLTSDHGWNLNRDRDALIPVINKLQAAGIRVSLFMDPDPEAIALVKDTGAERIELYTEAYANAWPTTEKDAVLAQYMEAAQTAVNHGLAVNAGHDLDLDNVAELCASGLITEVSIGHALTVEALQMGWNQAISAYLTRLA